MASYRINNYRKLVRYFSTVGREGEREGERREGEVSNREEMCGGEEGGRGGRRGTEQWKEVRVRPTYRWKLSM